VNEKKPNEISGELETQLKTLESKKTEENKQIESVLIGKLKTSKV
jgi:hypothetical protein